MIDVWDAIRRRQSTLQYQALSGIGHFHTEYPYTCDLEDCVGMDPLIELKYQIEDAENIIVNFLTRHGHVWDENGFCMCGWDGNA